MGAMATASNSVDVGFDLENVNSGTLKVTAEKGGLGFDVNIAASTSSADCTAQLAATTIKDPNSADVSSSCSSHCSNAVQSGEHWMAKNDPPLRDMCHFFPATQPGSLDKIQATMRSTPMPPSGWSIRARRLARRLVASWLLGPS